MRPLSSFVGQPIRSLQTMLRVIAEDDPTHLRIVPDGIYGPETTAAVSTFRSHIDNVVGTLYNVHIVFDDNNGMTSFDKLVKRFQKRVYIMKM